MKTKKPYISFVIVGRNDNYCEGFLYRTHRFLENLDYLCGKHSLDAEIIFVDWNPPKKEKSLMEVVNYIPLSKTLMIRYLMVNRQTHLRVGGTDKLPLLEAKGKNAAIRRADGEFIVCTNPDIIFNSSLIKFLSEKKLQKGYFYRTARYEMDKEIPTSVPKEELSEYCKNRYYSVFGMKYIWLRPQLSIKFIKNEPKIILRAFWHFLLRTFKPMKYKYMNIHGGAPGDFTMMSKKDWMKIRGYPEINVQGSIDGYSVSAAYASGINMKILKRNQRIYHQYHPYHGRSLLNFQTYVENISLWIKKKKNPLYNPLSWGLWQIKLKEKKYGN